LALWRAFWADLPLTWVGEIDRFLFRWAPPVCEAPTGDQRGAQLIWHTLSEKGAAQAGRAGAEVEDHPGLRG